MDIKRVVQVANQMCADGIIDHYAIGGAVGATFHLEPIATLDVDIFVSIVPKPGSLIISVQPIFDYLKTKGCTTEGEYIVIADTPVQFLSPVGPLGEEAVREAVETDLEEIPVRVMTAEHLAAIALETGRSKDKARLLQFLENPDFNLVKFEGIVTKYGLTDKWQRFKKQFLSDEHEN
jgi:hypothetical protein